jgi:Tol biopolymer transport system component
MKSIVSFGLALVLLISLLLGGLAGVRALGPAQAGGATTRVSVASDGTEGNDWAQCPSISADGRYVAFESDADNLTAGDTNAASDIFVNDRQTGETTRVSVASSGLEANGGSRSPAISANGRNIAFFSSASNLTPDDNNGTYDVFVHDRQMGETTRVSVDSNGVEANGYSANPSLSADGRYVAFESQANNLTPGDTNGAYDVFVHDRQTAETTRISVATGGTQGNGDSEAPSISADGRYVAFRSQASNLAADDTNGMYDVFVHDRQTGETERVSTATGGAQANHFSYELALSANGRYVAFDSLASNLAPGDAAGTWDVFVHDRQTGETTHVSVTSDGARANGDSLDPSISADGRYVAFQSDANNLAPGDANSAYDLFIHDRQTGETTCVSVTSAGVQGNGASDTPSISADGRYVAFRSAASDLVTGDANGTLDVFVHDRGAPPGSTFYLPIALR